MRDYLTRFLTDFEYDPADAAFLLSAYDKLTAHDEARELFGQAVAAYEADINCDYNALTAQVKKASRLVGVHNHTADLLLFICLSRHLQKLYAERGIDPAIFHDSMLDLRYKLEE